MKKNILLTILVSAGMTIGLGACGTKDDDPSGDGIAGDDDDDDDDNEGSGSGGVGTAGDDDDDDDDTAGDDSGGPATSGIGFIEMPDGGGAAFECDIFAQDCPEGEKCMPWANDGGSAWNATRCSPIEGDPGQPGDACTVDGSGVSGLDNCDIGGMCWDVDPEVLTGFCVALCSIGDVPCPDANSCVIANDGALAVCLPTCDPLAQDCDGGHGCYPFRNGDTSFACVPEGLLVEVGQQVPPMCPPGSTDVDGALLASCDDDAEVCCATFCDPAAPVCEGELVCSPLEDEPSVGLCLDA